LCNFRVAAFSSDVPYAELTAVQFVVLRFMTSVATEPHITDPTPPRTTHLPDVLTMKTIDKLSGSVSCALKENIPQIAET
jgi:hypothetical protein